VTVRSIEYETGLINLEKSTEIELYVTLLTSLEAHITSLFDTARVAIVEGSGSVSWYQPFADEVKPEVTFSITRAPFPSVMST
jgi:hypothetical protein